MPPRASLVADIAELGAADGAHVWASDVGANTSVNTARGAWSGAVAALAEADTADGAPSWAKAAGTVKPRYKHMR